MPGPIRPGRPKLLLHQRQRLLRGRLLWRRIPLLSRLDRALLPDGPGLLPAAVRAMWLLSLGSSFGAPAPRTPIGSGAIGVFSGRLGAGA